MRSVDKAIPTINPDRPAVEPFPAVLHIGITRQPTPVATWDDGEVDWDDAGATWDDTTAFPYDRYELWCRFHGMTITAGNPDAEGFFEAGHVEMSLDNRDGALSLYDETGALVDWQPGSPLDVWAVYGGEAFWLFSGRITAWREQGDGMLDVEAFDCFSDLNQFLAEWTPGAAGQSVPERLTAICTQMGYSGRRRFDLGHTTLLNEAVDVSGLEEMMRTARSDGGVIFADADGTLVYADRLWITGRVDQTVIPLLSDNYCDGGADIVWEARTTTADDDIVNHVTLANIAEPPLTVTKADVDSVTLHGPQTWPSERNDDLWSTVAEGAALADWIVNRRAKHRQRLEQAVLYLHDRRFDMWRVGLDTRLGDLVDWQHYQATTGGPALFQLVFVASTVTHEITPESWVTTLATTPAVDHRMILQWDRAPYLWDDTDAGNVWN
jgi:hypothetical protein